MHPVKICSTLVLILSTTICFAQYFDNIEASEADILRGALRAERTAYDVTHYDLSVNVNPDEKYITGSNLMDFRLLEPIDSLQVDLFENMDLDSITVNGIATNFSRRYNAVFVSLPELEKGQIHQMEMHFQGSPIVAAMPPWDGGFVWDKDSAGKDWIGVACEGIGASLWWPNKDHLSDEPDSMMIRITVPSGLMAVSNGNLVKEDTIEESSTFHWKVSYPINNYNVTVNVADYAHFNETYTSKESGREMMCDYYVLKENFNKATEHFKQVAGVLKAFEYFFGDFPFWDDGFALVETPYLGMEHQSAIAYGNEYMRGYKGGMIPSDMDWDYIIVHETGHEYFGNAVSVTDHADMWIHESFTTYMEALYVEYHYGRQAVDKYLKRQMFHGNREPIVGPYDINYDDWEHSDHYFKGSWILHTLRHVIGDDDTWFQLLRDLYHQFKMKTTNTAEIVEFINGYCGKDYSKYFEQYLFHPKIPVLEYKAKSKGKHVVLEARWISNVEGFSMPVELRSGNPEHRFEFTDQWSKVTIKNIDYNDLAFDKSKFLIKVKEVFE